MNIKIGFHLSHFSIRGSEVAIYDYAYYNNLILKNISYIIINKNFREVKHYNNKIIHNEDVYEKFKKNFEIIEYDTLENLDKILLEKNIKILYFLKSGEKDNINLKNVKIVNHCTFKCDKENFHGDIYIPVSKCLLHSEIKEIYPVLPHIVKPLHTTTQKILPEKLLKNKIVFGRYGGEETFNIDFVKETLIKVANENKNILFLFMNTDIFTPITKFEIDNFSIQYSGENENIIYISESADEEVKKMFINSCHALLHARNEGESFGLTVAEFSMGNKPIITFKPEKEVLQDNFVHLNHINILKEKGIYYTSKDDLYNILIKFNPVDYKDNIYEKIYMNYFPNVVMKKFKEYVIDKNSTKINMNIKQFKFEDILYTYYINDNIITETINNNIYFENNINHIYKVCKKLLNTTDIVIDTNPSIGFNTLRLSKFVKNVVAIEPHPDIFRLLEHNVKQNNINNIILVNEILCKEEKYIKTLNDDDNDFNIIKYYDEKDMIKFCEHYNKFVLNYNSDNISNLTKKLFLKIIGKEFDTILPTLKIKNNKIKMILMNNYGMEYELLIGMINILKDYKPYVIIPFENKFLKDNNINSVSFIKNLLNIFDYNCIEIYSLYPSYHLFYPIEKEDDINKLFELSDTTLNKINDNFYSGVTKRLKIIDNKKFKFKLLCNWTNNLYNDWKKFIPKENKNIFFTDNQEDIEADYSIIVNKPQHRQNYNMKKSIVFRMEPDTETANHWNDWYDSKDNFMYFLDLSKYRNNNEWHLSYSYDELLEKDFSKDKNKLLSTIVSSLYQSEGHKKRIDFLLYFEKYLSENSELPVYIDIYGRENNFNFKNYKGGLPYHKKDNSIIPYKYTFNAENCELKNYFTEKILDAILGETLCFYNGCPNISEFIDKRCYIVLDLNNKQDSVNTIINAIKNNEWEKRLPIIKKEKERIIKNYSLYPRIESLLKVNELHKYVINLDRRKDRLNEFIKQCDKVGFKGVNRFDAVDGKLIDTHNFINNISIKTLFRNYSGEKLNQGEIGCILSHFNLWKNNEHENNINLILEDDITFTNCFVDKLGILLRNVDFENIDILFIGYHIIDKIYNNINKEEYENLGDDYVINIKEICKKYYTVEDSFGHLAGGTFGYIITKKGIKKMLKIIYDMGFLWALDYNMLLLGKDIPDLNMYVVKDRLVFSEMYELTNKCDTDIQNTLTLFKRVISNDGICDLNSNISFSEAYKVK